MRILMINHEFTLSGASKMLFNLAVHYQDAGHDIIIFPVNPALGPMRDAYKARGISVFDQLVDEWFDLVIGNTIFAAPIIRVIRKSVATIWWIHEAEVGIRAILENPVWIEAFEQVAAVVFNMPFQRDEIFRPFISRIDQRRIFVIPNGIFAASDDQVADAQVAPVTAGAVRVVSVGSIEPRKRHADIIRAVAYYVRYRIDCVICGSFFNLEHEALGIVRGAPNNFRLISGLADEAVRAWVRSADIFCLASESETQAIAVYEAALLAKTLVISDLPCYRGVFAHGRQALLFPVGDVEVLAAMLEALAIRPSLRTRLGREAAAAAAPFTPQRFFCAFDDLVGRVT